MRSIGRMGAIAAALVLTFAFAACGGDDGGGGDTTASTGATASAGGGTTVTIRGNNFEPGELDVSAGTVTLTVTNEDAVTHTFTTDDRVVDEEIGGGETVEVTVDVSEDLGWHCEIHPSMRGKFVVT
jgi:plastocyanin